MKSSPSSSEEYLADVSCVSEGHDIDNRMQAVCEFLSTYISSTSNGSN